MKLHLSMGSGNIVTGYGAGYIEINRERHDSGLVVFPDQILTDWCTGGFSQLRGEDFMAILEFKPELILLGTGDAIRFPHPRLYANLTAARIGVDVMDVGAACRTFNVLAGEGRRVAAALLID